MSLNTYKNITIEKAIKLKSGTLLSSKNMSSNALYPVYGGNGISGYHNEFLFNESKIIIGRVGAHCGNVHKTEPFSWITDNALYIEKKLVDLDDDYLVYLLKSKNLNQYWGMAPKTT